MDPKAKLKPLTWMGSSRKDLSEFPDDVKDIMGYALYLAQKGERHPSAKPLSGFGNAKTLEVVDDHDGDTFRTVYTVRFDDEVYVLHAFQKKSKNAIATPKTDLDLIARRLKDAEKLHASRKAKQQK